MLKERTPRISLLNRIVLFLLAFFVTFLLELGIGYYQKAYVMEPLEEQTQEILLISQFLNDVEECINTLSDYRWDYGDTQVLISTEQALLKSASGYAAAIETDLSDISEEQHLLANAAKTTFGSLSVTVKEILSLLQEGHADDASVLYYSKAEPCGSYVRQYTQQLLEQAIEDNQSTYVRLSRLSNALERLQRFIMATCFILGAVVAISLFALLKLVIELSRASHAISQGNLNFPDVNEALDDQIGNLAKTFNDMKHTMKHRLELMNEKAEMERMLHKKEREALEWQSKTEQQRHQQLRSQINPHFLFNTLNVIMYTARQEGAERTNRLLGSLSKLFRYVLASNDILVPLAREIHIVDEYFSLHRARFGDRVQLKWCISPDTELTQTMVPSFILQPLVENSFKHGIGPKEEGGSVSIRIWTEEDILYIQVIDDGIGIEEDVLQNVQANLDNRKIVDGEHIGVYNISARLRLYGERFGLKLSHRDGGGTVAALCVPLIIQKDEEDEPNDSHTDCG